MTAGKRLAYYGNYIGRNCHNGSLVSTDYGNLHTCLKVSMPDHLGNTRTHLRNVSGNHLLLAAVQFSNDLKDSVNCNYQPMAFPP